MRPIVFLVWFDSGSRLGMAMMAFAGGCESADAKAKGGKKMIHVTSPAFAQGQPIPKKHTGEGADVSPRLVGRICRPVSRNWR